MNNSHLTVNLTKTEKLILQLIAYEFSSKEIAQLLDIGHQTVYTHRANLLLKLDVKNSAGLVRKAIERSLLMPLSEVYSSPRIRFKIEKRNQSITFSSRKTATV